MHKMKQLLLAAALILGFGLVTDGSSAYAGGAKQLPKEFALKGLKGGTLKATQVKGKMVVLQFWASWCVGCGQVMGLLAPVVAQYDDALYLPISVDESMAEARSYFKKQVDAVKPLEAKSWLDTDAVLASALKVEALPAVMVADANGKIVKSYVGHLNAAQVKEIKALLAAE